MPKGKASPKQQSSLFTASATKRPNMLYNGDNLDVLREHIDDESIDLVYLDPPFNSGRDYNMLYGAQAQEKAFKDTWDWIEASPTYEEVIRTNRPAAFVLEMMRKALGEGPLLAYASMMAIRLFELHRVLKPTGCLYLHCDPTASHYLKMLLDAVFGPPNFLSEIIWKRTGSHSSARRWGPVHDVLLCYAKTEGSQVWNRPYSPLSDEHRRRHYRNKDDKGRTFTHGELTAPGTRNGRSGAVWRGFDVTAIGRHWCTTVEKLDELDKQRRIYFPVDGGWPRLIRFESESKGRAVGDVWDDIAPLNMKAKERVGYPTQKPVALLKRIIEASTNPGQVVLDPFCGCGTTIEAAQTLGRRWIGIDVASRAIVIIKDRLRKQFGDIATSSFGEIDDPADEEGAKQLAANDKHAFEQWAVDLLGGAIPNKKKGADRGVDGRITFRESASAPASEIILSVKGGATSAKDVRDLHGTVQREKAAMGVLISLNPPTRPMLKEAASCGTYTTQHTPVAESYPRIQILTVKDILDGVRIKAPASVPQKPPKKRASKQLGFMFVYPGHKA